MSIEGNIKMSGYLDHKWRKRVIAFWHPTYCVLNGNNLLFYKTESSFKKFNKYHDSLDLSLAYEVKPSLHIDNGITISTHFGPHYLRAKEQESCRLWLDALQSMAVQRRTLVLPSLPNQVNNDQSDIAFETVAPHRIQNTTKNLEKKSGNQNLLRFSTGILDFIPGQGKKYPSYDGGREARKSAFEMSGIQSGDFLGTKPTNESVNRRSSKAKKIRPISASVSDFLLLNDSTKKENESSNKLVSEKKTNLLRPRLPTSSSVTKFLSHLEPKAGTNTPTSLWNSEKRKSKSMNNLQTVENAGCVVLKQHKSATQLEIQVPSENPVSFKSNVHEEVNQVQKQHMETENPTEANDQVAQIREKKGEKKKHNTSRRRSSLAVIKNFFFPKKISKEKSPDPTHSIPTVSHKNKEKEKDTIGQKTNFKASPDIQAQRRLNKEVVDVQLQNTSVSESSNQTKFSEENNHLDKPQQIKKVDEEIRERQTHVLSQISEGGLSVEEEPFIAEKSYESEAKVIEIIEPEPHSAITKDEQEKTITEQRPSSTSKENPASKQRPESRINECYDWEKKESKPPLPIKTKNKCPSPDYDIPRSTSISSASSLNFVDNQQIQFVNCTKIQLDKVESLELHECQSLELNVGYVLESITKSGPTNMEDNSQEKDCNNPISNSSSNKTSTVEPTLNNPQEMEPPRSKPINISSGLSNLVNFFNNDATLVEVQNDLSSQKSKTEGANSLSFA